MGTTISSIDPPKEKLGNSNLGASNEWVWGGHNWVGYIKPIYPLKPI